MPRGNGFLPVLFEVTPVPYCQGDKVSPSLFERYVLFILGGQGTVEDYPPLTAAPVSLTHDILGVLKGQGVEALGDQVFNRTLPLLFGQVVQPSLIRVYGMFLTLSWVTGPNGNGLVPSIFQVGLPLPHVNRHILVSHGKMSFLFLHRLYRKLQGGGIP